jgi:alpha-beta hydrolase superfamily lysophospholipase
LDAITNQSRRRRILSGVGWAILALTILSQVLAWNHARKFMTFSDAVDRTRPPEKLGRWERLVVLFRGVDFPRPTNRRTPMDVGLGFETLRIPAEPEVMLEAWRIPAPKESPARGVILLFHGYGGSKDGLLGMGMEFHRMGLEVWLTDFRGVGGSSGSTTSLGYHEAEDVRAVYGAAADRAPGLPVFLHGASMGAAAVMRAVAELGIRPVGIVGECTFARFQDAVENRFAVMGLPRNPGGWMLTFWGGRVAGFDAFQHQPVEYLRRIRIPVLLIHGDRDTRVRSEEAEELGRAAAGPVKLARLADSGHEGGLATSPTEWRRALEAFLDAHLPPPSR